LHATWMMQPYSTSPEIWRGRAREANVALLREDAIGPLRAQTTHTVPRMPLDNELFPLRERGVVGTCTNSNFLCYNSFTGQGQLLWVGVCP
jgi:hypothetical protein